MEKSNPDPSRSSRCASNLRVKFRGDGERFDKVPVVLLLHSRRFASFAGTSFNAEESSPRMARIDANERQSLLFPLRDFAVFAQQTAGIFAGWENFHGDRQQTRPTTEHTKYTE